MDDWNAQVLPGLAARAGCQPALATTKVSLGIAPADVVGAQREAM
jgi:hypothetical protein